MTPTQRQTNLASFFFALGHKRRLMVCELLLRHGATGLSFGSLQQKTHLCASTLCHHLAHMDKGGILRRRIKANETWISIDFNLLNTTQNGFSNSCEQTVAITSWQG